MRSTRSTIYSRVVSALIVCALAALPQQRAGASSIRYVKAAGLSSGSCLTWATACTLQAALSVAGSGDQLWVKKGTYKPSSTGDRTATFHLKSGVAVYGGFAGTETALTQRSWKTNTTTLSGDIGTVGVWSDDSYHVVTGGDAADPTDSTALLDGFTITRGFAYGPDPYQTYGAGVFNQSSSPTFKNLIIQYNSAVPVTTWAGGGGMANFDSNPSLTNVVFNSNDGHVVSSGSAYGGGMFNHSSSPVMKKVQFTGNSASSGGGLYNDYYSTPQITNAVFSGNTVNNYGGAIYSDSSNLYFTLTNVAFEGNSAAAGGAMYNYASSPTITNATFYNNSATDCGGAIANYLDGGTLTNTTFTLNHTNSPSVGGAIWSYNGTVHVYDSILYGDSPNEMDSNGSAVIETSTVQGGCPSSGGVTCTDVGSFNPYLGTLKNNGGFGKTMSLGVGSLAIDGGDPATCAPKDARGVVRPQGAACDLGAYEVRVKTFTSVAIYDGDILETSETSGLGGTVAAAGTSLRVGDNGQDRQFRSFLSFNTAGLPDGAAVVATHVQLKKSTIAGDSDPWATHGGELDLDLAKPYFGTTLDLTSLDFQAASTIPNTSSTEPAARIDNYPVSGWYSGELRSTALLYVNKKGTTQFRLYFPLDDDDDLKADIISFFSGNATTAGNRPRLEVYYNP